MDSLPVQVVYYGSTEQSCVSGNDGFGIRYHSPELPQTLLSKLEEYKLFYYSAGNMALAGVADLIDAPQIIDQFPKAYAFFSEVVDGIPYYVFARTVYIGRDYGWYLSPQQAGARAGNTFTHAYIFQYEHPPLLDLLAQGAQKKFRPFKLHNEPHENPELVTLLTGNATSRGLLQTLDKTWATKPMPTQPQTISAEMVSSLFAVFTAHEQGQALVVSGLHHPYALAWLQDTLLWVPQVMHTVLSFTTNYQEYGFESPYKILLLNETYEGIAPQTGLNYVLYQADAPAVAPTGETIWSDFFNYVWEEPEARTAELVNFLNFIDQGLASCPAGTLPWDTLLKAWKYFAPEDTTWAHTTATPISSLLKALWALPIKEAFKKQLETQVTANALRQLQVRNYEAFQIYLFEQLITFQLLASPKIKGVKPTLTKLVADHIDSFSRLPHTLLQKLFPWLHIPSIEDQLISWLSQTWPQDFDRLLEEIVVSKGILGKDEAGIVEMLIDWQVPMARFSTLCQKALRSSLSEVLETNRFFPGMEEQAYLQYLDATTQAYIETQPLQKARSLAELAFAARPQLYLQYITPIINREILEAKSLLDLLQLMQEITQKYRKKVAISITPEASEQISTLVTRDFDFDGFYNGLDAQTIILDFLEITSKGNRDRSEYKLYNFLEKAERWLHAEKIKYNGNTPVLESGRLAGLFFLYRQAKAEAWEESHKEGLTNYLNKTLLFQYKDKAYRKAHLPFAQLIAFYKEHRNELPEGQAFWEGHTLSMAEAIFEEGERLHYLRNTLWNDLKQLIQAWNPWEERPKPSNVWLRLYHQTKRPDFKKWLSKNERNVKSSQDGFARTGQQLVKGFKGLFSAKPKKNPKK